MKLAEFRALTRKRPPKYRNHKVTIGEIRFDSKREARRYQVLVLLQRAGKITELRRQVRYHLDVNGVHICDYVLDFQYRRDGVLVYEDSKTKGTRTRNFIIKQRLMLACHGIRVEEV